MEEEQQRVIPGQALGSVSDFESGAGTFVRQSIIHASLLGRVISSASTTMDSLPMDQGNAKPTGPWPSLQTDIEIRHTNAPS